MLSKEEVNQAMARAREVDSFQSAYGGDLSTQRRNAAVRGLAASLLEGKHASPELIADVQAWIRGELTTEEVTRRVIERGRAAGEVEGGQDTV